MNFQQLVTFHWTVKLGSFTDAAAKLNTAQSTVSMRIGELERELGVQLLDRSSKRIRVTPKGRDLLRYAEQIEMLLDEVRHHIGDAEQISGSLRLGVAELVALTWLSDLVGALNTRYPRVEVDLDVGLSGNLRDKLEEGALDVVILPMPFGTKMRSPATSVGTVPFAFMGAPSVYPHKSILASHDFENFPVITLGPGSVISDLQDMWFQSVGARPLRLDRSNSMEVSAKLVRSGLGISLLPVDFYADDLTSGRMQILKVERALPRIEFFALGNSKRVSPLAKVAIDLARSLSTFSKSEAESPARDQSGQASPLP